MSNIIRVPAATAGTVPDSGVDYQDQNDLLFAFGLWGMQAFPLRLDDDVVVKGAIFNLGGVVYKASADEPIAGTPSFYVKLTPISVGAQCSATYVASLTGVSWSDTYNGYYDVFGNLYLFDEAQALGRGVISSPKTFFGKAFQNIQPRGISVLTSAGAGNFTVPDRVFAIKVTLIGGGGCGGNSGAGGSIGGNGTQTSMTGATTAGGGLGGGANNGVGGSGGGGNAGQGGAGGNPHGANGGSGGGSGGPGGAGTVGNPGNSHGGGGGGAGDPGTSVCGAGGGGGGVYISYLQVVPGQIIPYNIGAGGVAGGGGLYAGGAGAAGAIIVEW